MKQFIALMVIGIVFFFWGCELPTEPAEIIEVEVHDTTWAWIGIDTLYTPTGEGPLADTLYVVCPGSDMSIGIRYNATWVEKDLIENSGRIQWSFRLKYYGTVESQPVGSATVKIYLSVNGNLVETLIHTAEAPGGVWDRGEVYPSNDPIKIFSGRHDLGVEVDFFISVKITG